MPPHTDDHATMAFERAESRLLASCGVQVASRRVRLADPPVSVRVLEAGDGPPLVLVHGSGMSASTWAPLMPYLATHRLCRSRSCGGSRKPRPEERVPMWAFMRVGCLPFPRLSDSYSCWDGHGRRWWMAQLAVDRRCLASRRMSLCSIQPASRMSATTTASAGTVRVSQACGTDW